MTTAKAFLLAVMRDTHVDMRLRVDAAIAVLPYCHVVVGTEAPRRKRASKVKLAAVVPIRGDK